MLMILFWLQKDRNCCWKCEEKGRGACVKAENMKVMRCQVSRTRSRIPENIHVVFSERELVSILPCVWRVTVGFNFIELS